MNDILKKTDKMEEPANSVFNNLQKRIQDAALGEAKSLIGGKCTSEFAFGLTDQKMLLKGLPTYEVRKQSIIQKFEHLKGL